MSTKYECCCANCFVGQGPCRCACNPARELAELRAALQNLVDYVDANKKYIPLHMGSKNTGALSAAKQLLDQATGGDA